jgi:peroxiredoxin
VPGQNATAELGGGKVTERVNWKTIGFNVFLTVVLVFILGLNYTKEKAALEDAARMQGPPPGIGEKIEDFLVINDQGKKLSFSEVAEGDTVLVFWSIGCTPSVWALEALETLTAETSNVTVVPVNVADSVSSSTDFFAEKGFNLPVYTDAGKSAKWAFKVKITPAIYLIDESGVIKYRQLGLSSQGLEFLRRILEKARAKLGVLNDQVPSAAKVEAFYSSYEQNRKSITGADL